MPAARGQAADLPQRGSSGHQTTPEPHREPKVSENHTASVSVLIYKEISSRFCRDSKTKVEISLVIELF